jgi:hypothetical protein
LYSTACWTPIVLYFVMKNTRKQLAAAWDVTPAPGSVLTSCHATSGNKTAAALGPVVLGCCYAVWTRR